MIKTCRTCRIYKQKDCNYWKDTLEATKMLRARYGESAPERATRVSLDCEHNCADFRK